MLVFRAGRRQVAVRRLLEQLRTLCPLDALLRAGELECGLADAGAPATEPAAALTGSLSELLLAPAASSFARASACAEDLCRLPDLPDSVVVSVPEGFAYYALHPLDYAEVVDRLPRAQAAVVVGIRTIGATLSAVARAAFAQRGVCAERLTVRPIGHPWERVLELSVEQRQRVRQGKARGAHFLVVDEGPGLSGSSFLATAEALEAAEVPRERITLVGSHAVEPARLCARDAAARWARFRYVAVESPVRLADTGAEWRSAECLADWAQFARRKFLSRDGKTLYKFEGLGPYGDEPLARAQRLAELGFGPRVERAEHGHAAYELLRGRPMRAAGLDAAMLGRLAEYCAARAREFPATSVDVAALREMVAVNAREGLGVELTADLEVERPVIADAKMQPHEWVGGLKTDAASHGDDHFFPGPADIAWDLAGAMVEWEMDGAAAEEFLEHYRRLSGDDARPRLAAWKLAYTLFRLGYCQMAAGAGEDAMKREAGKYRALLGASVSAAA